MNKEMIKVSVIVPVYNTKVYLAECIESIINQTLHDIEVILVDDGSTDGSGSICDQYSNRDMRIKVIHQKNQGQSASRNHGIASAQGKYIGFVDSDDVIHPQMLEYLAKVLDESDYQFVHCAFHREEDAQPKKNEENFVDFQSSDLQEYSSQHGMLKMMDWKTYGHYIWKGLYRKQFITGIPFDEGVLFEDIIWSAKVIGEVSVYGYIPLDFYTYRMRDDSTVHSFGWDTQNMYFKAIIKYLEIAREKTPEIASELEVCVYQAIIERCCKCIKLHTIGEREIRQIAGYAKRCNIRIPRVLKLKMGFRRKSIYVLSVLSFSKACRVRNMLINR